MAIKENLKSKSKDFQNELGGNLEVENSIEFRVVITITVIIGILSTFLIEEDNFFIPSVSIFLTLFGSYVSNVRKNKKNWWIKLILSLFMLVAFANFLREAISNPYDPRVPLTNLLIWLQVLHSFDLPRRKDLNYSLFVALILICVTATISRDLYFGFFLVPFGIASLLSLLYNNLSKNKITQLKIEGEKDLVIKTSIKPLIFTILGMVIVFLFMPRYQTMKVKTFPVSIKLPEIPNFQGEVKSKTNKEIKKDKVNGKDVLNIKRNFDKNAYYGFSTELDLNFRGKLSDEIVIKVRSSEKTYLRGMAFDLYDGKNWKMTKPYELRKIFADRPPIYTRMSLEVKKDLSPKRELIQTFYIEKEQSNLVFSSPYAEEVYFPSTYLMADTYGGLRSPVELVEGLTYTVVSSVPEFNKKDLQSLAEPLYISDQDYKKISSDDDFSKALNKIYKLDTHTKSFSEKLKKNMSNINIFTENYFQLPNNISKGIIQLAEEITKKSTNQFDKSMDIQNFLQTNFKYNLEIPEFPEDAETVNYFLFNQKEGYCEHFATSMVVMLRSIGIPSRLVTGFSPGTYNQITAYHEIKSSDAHAWVEVYFPKRGWVIFDPTPGYVANLSQKKNEGNVLALYYLSKIYDFLKKYIPESIINFAKSSLENTINAFILIFSYISKFIFSLDIKSMFIIIIISSFILLLGIFINFKIKTKKQLEQKQNKLKSLFESKLRLEIVNIQESFIKDLEKIGYKYESYYTFNEYLKIISLKNTQLESYFSDFISKTYFLRYGESNLSEKDLENYKKESKLLLEKIIELSTSLK
jgi:transglutaminase-like putative cysteine protease